MTKAELTGTLTFRINPEWIFPLEKLKIGRILLDCFEDCEIGDFDYKVVYELEEYNQYYSDVDRSQTLVDEKKVTYYMVYEDQHNYFEEEITDEFIINEIQKKLL
jgi:hypothetical protein